jgi:hypothetical protein
VSGVDWSALYNAQRFPEQMLYVAEQQRKAEKPAASAPSNVTLPAERLVPTVVLPQKRHSAPDDAKRSEPARSVPMLATCAVGLHADPVETLLAALDAAHDDDARATLLAAAPQEVREQLAHTLAYRRFIADVARELENDERKRSDFMRLLDAAVDDAARRALITATDPKFLAEWRWRARATEDAWLRRYMALVGVTTT